MRKPHPSLSLNLHGVPASPTPRPCPILSLRLTTTWMLRFAGFGVVEGLIPLQLTWQKELRKRSRKAKTGEGVALEALLVLPECWGRTLPLHLLTFPKAKFSELSSLSLKLWLAEKTARATQDLRLPSPA